MAEHLAQARRPYDLIAEAVPGSPQWIVRHYRYRPDAGLLHDWQADLCHEVVGPVAHRAVELAYRGEDLPAITSVIAAEFAAPRGRVAADLAGLFARLDPATGPDRTGHREPVVAG